jgi:membrane-bound lytic murein transglycosylase A
MKIKLFYTFVASVLLLQIYSLFWSPMPHELNLHKVAFSQLPGWHSVNPKKSLLAFQISCKAFLKQAPDKAVGSQFIDLKAKDWYPVCEAVNQLDASSNDEIKQFFQTWFSPVEFYEDKPVNGLFTGYFMPLLHGSLTKTSKYNVPIYGLPKSMVTANLRLFSADLAHRKIVGRVHHQKVLPFYTRAEINQGVIDGDAPVIVWVDNPLDRLTLEIEGSGVVQLTDGSQIVVGYAGENGAPYTSIARVLIDQGVMTRDNASMQHIRRYLDEHPHKMNAVLNRNKSFVFFTKLKQSVALGSQGVALTPGYSLAVDRKWVPMGVPIWLTTTRPDHQSEQQKEFHRLMIAQDTGGAIRGAVRGDVYWGAGEKATEIAGRMKNMGHYWLLLPRHTIDRLNTLDKTKPLG